MAAAPKGSAPGPVKLCVGECRPELRAQSSQLYSFVVILSFNHINFVHLARKQTSSVCSELGGTELVESLQVVLSNQGAAIKYKAQ